MDVGVDKGQGTTGEIVLERSLLCPSRERSSMGRVCRNPTQTCKRGKMVLIYIWGYMGVNHAIKMTPI